jgi:hypothetical protein
VILTLEAENKTPKAAANPNTTAWDLRKCSASALDRLARTFGEQFKSVFWPLVELRLADKGHW